MPRVAQFAVPSIHRGGLSLLGLDDIGHGETTCAAKGQALLMNESPSILIVLIHAYFSTNTSPTAVTILPISFKGTKACKGPTY